MMALKPKVQTVHKKIYHHLYIQVLFAIFLGIFVGYFFPSTGSQLKPLGDAFIKLIKIIITPVVFLTLTVGIAQLSDLKKVGSLAGKSLLYFIIVSTFALLIGLCVVNIFQPGHGLNINPASLDSNSVQSYVQQSHQQTIGGFLYSILPTTLISPFNDGNILQVIFVSVLFGLSLSLTGKAGQKIIHFLEDFTAPIFKMVSILMRFSPIGAFGAMAFTIGHYGIASLANLFYLVLLFYLTSIFFIIVVLGLICRYHKIPLWALLRYLKEELLLILGASSSEAALPSLIEKMEKAGAKKSVVGIVIPMGYSFNLDGTNIYMTLAAIFIAQAMNIPLTFQEQILILLVAIISSKGAAGVTGAGFITLAATLSVIPTIPVAGMALILGIDRFMSECRSLTNFIGNAVATLAIANWEKSLDYKKLNQTLHPSKNESSIRKKRNKNGTS